MDKYIHVETRDIIESVLVLFLLLGLMLALYDVLRVFFGVLTFALIFSVSFQKPFRWLVKILKNRRKLAGFIYSVILVVVIAVPLVYIFSAFSTHVKRAMILAAKSKKKDFHRFHYGCHTCRLLVNSLPLFGRNCNRVLKKLSCCMSNK